jgi:hypothetical protein
MAPPVAQLQLLAITVALALSGDSVADKAGLAQLLVLLEVLAHTRMIGTLRYAFLH